MKNLLTPMLAALGLLVAAGGASAAGDAKAELKDLVGRINAKVTDGRGTEAELAPELKEFDTLLAAHAGEQTDEVARILAMEATLYGQILANPAKARELLGRLQAEFPATGPGRQVPMKLAELDKQAAAKTPSSTPGRLAVGAVFPGFAEKDSNGQPLVLENFRGKVVLLDFWATWCGPCVHELPNVVAAYRQHHAQGFEIVGISLDREGDGPKLAAFTKSHDMPWPQYYDGQYWHNKLASQYGVRSIPATYLLDGEGRIIGKNLRGAALEAAVVKALAAK